MLVTLLILYKLCMCSGLVGLPFALVSLWNDWR